MKHLILKLIAVSGLGLASYHQSSTEEQLLPSEIIRDAVALKGQVVRARGYLDFGADSRGLWDKKSDIRRSYRYLKRGRTLEHCITVYVPGDIEKRLHELSNSTVTIVGVILDDRDDKTRIQLWSCSHYGIRVRKVLRTN